MIKLVVMIKRKPGMSKEEFDRYWSGPHAEQVLGWLISNDTYDDMCSRML